MDAHPDGPSLEQLNKVSAVFRPSGPIDQKDLFSGRVSQLADVQDAVLQTGRHALIFGERGVGKTSLAAVSLDLCGPSYISMRINCDVGDNFATMWTKVIDELGVHAALTPNEGRVHACERACEILQFEEIGPGDVRRALAVLSASSPVLIFFDEFDRVQDASTRVMMTDLIKTLSDQLVPATIVLIGVADDVESLIERHASVSRAMAEIRMPRMTVEEIQQIISRGLSEIGIPAAPRVMHFLSHLPQGLPHYAHLLAQQAARSAILSGHPRIEEDDLRVALSIAVDNADESMMRAFADATTSSQQTLYESVLLACALAPVDDVGYFAPGDLRTPLFRITRQEFAISRFARHLIQFCGERGPVLERRGREHRWRYRFIEPMMRPFLIMRALAMGLSADVLDLSPVLEPTTEPGQLF